MSALERRLQEALRAEADAVEPAPDLFTRVQGSIHDDRRRRSQQRRAAAMVAALVGALAAVVFAVSDIQAGRLLMDWWVLELITNVTLVGLALWLGPFIKRFGRSYAADVFRANPRTGKSYIILTDLVYYLLFAAYILFTVRFQPYPDWSPTVGAGQLQYETARVGGILLIIGVLHGLNILVMPVLGRLFASLGQHLGSRPRPDRSERAS
jgi:type III secretory pathway component EscS